MTLQSKFLYKIITFSQHIQIHPIFKNESLFTGSNMGSVFLLFFYFVLSQILKQDLSP